MAINGKVKNKQTKKAAIRHNNTTQQWPSSNINLFFSQLVIEYFLDNTVTSQQLEHNSLRQIVLYVNWLS
jgi:hypothetical protein